MLLHIGTRDLQQDGVKESEFVELLDTCIKVWKNTKVFVSLITERKDKSVQSIDEANRVIMSVCSNYSHVTVIDKFKPTDEMFYDQVHLNNKFGLPAMIRHLKSAMNLPVYNPSEKQRHSQNRAYNRPPSAPLPHRYNVQHNPSSGNLDMNRPLSNPSVSENTPATNSVQHVNMMNHSPSVPHNNIPWLPQNQPMIGFPPWTQPWNFTPFNPWFQSTNMFPQQDFSR